MRILIAAISIVMLLATAAFGQTQPWSLWNDVHITSALPDNAGSVTVSIKHDGKTWKSFEVDAFGKKQSLSDKQLEALRLFPPESLRFASVASGALVISFSKEDYFPDSERYAAAPTPVVVTTSVSISFGSKEDPTISEPAKFERPMTSLFRTR